jgi:hypothetical protein
MLSLCLISYALHCNDVLGRGYTDPNFLNIDNTWT